MSNELVPIGGESLPANIDEELRKNILADMEDASKETAEAIEFKPPLIAIGKATWLIGESEEPIQSFRGIILHHVKANAIWYHADKENPIILDTFPEGYEIGGKIPLCSSTGAISGSLPIQDGAAHGRVVNCFGNCGSGKGSAGAHSPESKDCYLNTFGSAVTDSGEPGKGKACKNMRRLLILVEGRRYPHLLSLPPTSLNGYDAYCRHVEAQNKNVSYIWTTFTLEKQQNESGQLVWYIFNKEKAFDGIGALDENLYQQVYNFRQEHKELLGRVEITEAEYETPRDADFEIEDDNIPQPEEK